MSNQIIQLGNLREGTPTMQNPSSGRVFSGGGIAPTILARDYKDPKLVLLEDNEVKQYRIRKLTPKECWRLMGFSDEDFEKAAAVNSNTHLYAQAGNSIVVNVLEAIFGQMIEPAESKLDIEEPLAAVQEQIEEQEKEKEMSEPKEVQQDELLEKFRGMLMDSDKVKLYGSINSGNFMIHIEDAVELLKNCLAG